MWPQYCRRAAESNRRLAAFLKPRSPQGVWRGLYRSEQGPPASDPSRRGRIRHLGGLAGALAGPRRELFAGAPPGLKSMILCHADRLRNCVPICDKAITHSLEREGALGLAYEHARWTRTQR